MLESHIAMMEAMGLAIAKRDSDTGAHNYRVAWIAARIGEELELQSDAMQALIVGSFFCMTWARSAYRTRFCSNRADWTMPK